MSLPQKQFGTPAPLSVSGGAAKTVEPENVLKDGSTGGLYKRNFPFKRVPTPDPSPTSLGQYLAETFHRPHVLERILHADIGDPELGMGEKPPYVRVYPQGISLAVYPGVAEISLHNKYGNVIVGATAFRNPSEQISVGGICSLNPLLMNCIPSSEITPIPTFIFTIKQSPLFKAAANSPSGSPTDKAIETSKNEEAIADPEPAQDFKVKMDTGHELIVSGATNKEEVRAQAMKVAQENNTGCRAAKITSLGRISSEYGNRIHPITGQYKMHTGVDVATPMGTAIPAPQAGVVKQAGYSSSYGNFVEIQHADGTTTKYAHLQGFDVKPGQQVTKGQTFARVGSTGMSTGAHLHFETRDAGGQLMDPKLWESSQS